MSEPIRTHTETLIKALHILSNEIECHDGIATSTISEAAFRMDQLYSENLALRRELIAIKSRAQRKV